MECKVRYVGQTRSHPKERYRSHLSLKQVRTPKEKWIRGLINKELKPQLIILETFEGDVFDPRYELEPSRAEKRWMKQLAEAGHPLTNYGY